VYDGDQLADAPSTFKSTAYRGNEHKGKQFTIQVAPEDCTGCNLCVNVCPAKDRTNPKHKAIDMHPQAPLRDSERANYDFFLNLPEIDRTAVAKIDHKSSQFLEPLFEYSGACAGCGETPYLKLLTQLFGDRLPAAHRQRHRMFVDLRGQSAHDAVHDQSRRQGTGVVELALRGQRRVRVRLPARARRARRRCAGAPEAHRIRPRRRSGHRARGCGSIERSRYRGPA
jgi:ferredoxin